MSERGGKWIYNGECPCCSTLMMLSERAVNRHGLRCPTCSKVFDFAENDNELSDTTIRIIGDAVDRIFEKEGGADD